MNIDEVKAKLDVLKEVAAGTSKNPYCPSILHDEEGRRFMWSFSSNDRYQAVVIAESYGATIKDFGVSIDRIDTKTKKVIDWTKKEGVSLWK